MTYLLVANIKEGYRFVMRFNKDIEALRYTIKQCNAITHTHTLNNITIVPLDVKSNEDTDSENNIREIICDTLIDYIDDSFIATMYNYPMYDKDTKTYYDYDYLLI